MKVLLIVFVLYAQTFSINAFGLKKNVDLDALQNAIDSKCSTGTDGNKKQFTESMRNFERCINHAMENSTVRSPPLGTSPDFCSFLQESQFYICLKKFTKDISPCLNDNEIYIQKLLLDAYDAGYEEICGINGVSNFDYLYNKVNDTQECMIICLQFFFSYGSCTANLNIFKQLETGVLNLNKNDMCLDLESFHTCSTNVLEGICNEEFTRFTNLVFHPLLASCNDLNENK